MDPVSPWIFVILLRLTIPLFILLNPLGGSIISLIVEMIDMPILQLFGVREFSTYQPVDKTLDTYMYLFQGYTMLFWNNEKARYIGFALLLFRIGGVIMFYITGDRGVLFLFPDVFIFYYMFYVIYKAIFRNDPFMRLRPIITVLVVLTSIKLYQEYLLHVVEFSFYQLVLFPTGFEKVFAGK
ncbi:hypothetical protein HY469_04300 [Candidatus Roizmanbacteria bacterium]|nr:hypothetical protein [Candidatus Roizmanbacteria bacterium]